MDQHEDSLHAMDKAFQLAVELYEIDEKQARVHGHSSSSVPFSVNGGDGKADGASRTSPSPVVFLPMTADKNDSSVGNTGGHFPVPPSPLKSGAMTTGGLQVQPMTAGFQSIPSTAFNPSRIISALQFSANRTSSITDAESAPVTPAIASGKQRDYKLFTITQLQTGVARGKSKMAEYERWIAEGDTRTLLKWKTNRA